MSHAPETQPLSHSPDPFAHHPELRALVKPPDESFWRSFQPESLDEMMAQQGLAPAPRLDDATIARTRRDALMGWPAAAEPTGDLWIFAYGSLMWDPAIRFTELRRARIEGYARRFCLYDTLGGRGTPDQPGLMAGLDTGPHCDGLVFRIAAADAEAETEILWRREMILPAYIPTWVRADLSDGPVTALTFVADHAAELIRTDLSRDQQIECLARAHGFMGTSLHYIDSLVAHMEQLGVHDPDTLALRDAARARAAALGLSPAPQKV
jgi:cation transport protein ChaC